MAYGAHPDPAPPRTPRARRRRRVLAAPARWPTTSRYVVGRRLEADARRRGPRSGPTTPCTSARSTSSIGRDATLQRTPRWPWAATSCGSARRSSTAEPGGDAELAGLGFADAGQHLEQRLLVDHAESRSCTLQRRDLQERAAGRQGRHRRPHGVDRRRAHPGQAAENTRHVRAQPQPGAHRATPAPTRSRTWRSRPARSPGPGTPAPPAASTTSSCSTCSRRGIPEATWPAGSSSAGSSARSSSKITLSPTLRERLEAAIEAELEAVGV